MKRKSLVTLILSLMLAAAAIGQNSAPRGGFDRSNLDESCAPCQDFYKYVNGGWLKKNPIPAAFSTWGIPHRLNEANTEALRGILEAAAANKQAPAGSNEKKIGDLYTSCMDEQAIEALGAKPLDPFLAGIKKVKDTRSLQAAIAQFHAKGVGAMFGFGVGGDAKNSTMNVAYAGQGGLSLPDRDYYLKQDDKSKETRVEYAKHVAKMFELLGDAPAQAEAQAKTVLAIETKLAEASMDRVEARNPLKTYFKKSLAELKQMNTNFSWEQYFSDIGHSEIKEVVVRQPDFFAALDREMTATPIADWQIYLRWKLVTGAATALPARFDQENFRFFSGYLQGTKEQLPRWRRCVTVVDNNLGEALGQEYVKKHYPAEAKARMNELIGNLVAALREEIGQVEWMSDATRKQAIEKLNAFTPRIGHTDKWQDYSKLAIDRGAYSANLLRANEFATKDNWNKVGKPVDRGEWVMTPSTVNAYYHPVNNEIVFPAGILQPPFFDFTADDAFNYGAIGGVIGHEISHGFDNNGRRFDSSGNIRDWWTAEDGKKYDERAACIEQQYAGFQAMEGLNLNGKLVLGEAIGDLGGLKIAYRAWKKSLAGKPTPPVIDGFTAEQRFFLGFGRVWGINFRPEALRLRVQTDPHAPGPFRCNGTVMNMPEFAAAFGCKAGDAMVRAPRCAVW